MTIPLIIVGAGGFGREVAWLVESINAERPRYELLGFLDDTASSTPEAYPVLGTLDNWLAAPERGVQVACAVGDPTTRFRIVQRLDAAGVTFATLVDPSLRSSRWVEIGPGGIVCAATVFTTNIRIGPHAIINLDCTIGHDSQIGAFASLMPGVHISGEVDLGIGIYLGTGAVVINRIRIGDWTVIGAGAVVSRDLPSRVVAVGIPAKAIKANADAPAEQTTAENARET